MCDTKFDSKNRLSVTIRWNAVELYFTVVWFSINPILENIPIYELGTVKSEWVKCTRSLRGWNQKMKREPFTCKLNNHVWKENSMALNQYNPNVAVNYRFKFI